MTVSNNPTTAYRSGREAKQLGQTMADNPFDSSLENHTHWEQGWLDGLREERNEKPLWAFDHDIPSAEWGDHSSHAIIIDPPDYACTDDEWNAFEEYKHELGTCGSCDYRECLTCRQRPQALHERVPDPLKFLLDHLQPETIARIYHDVTWRGTGTLSEALQDVLIEYNTKSLLPSNDDVARFECELSVLRGEYYAMLGDTYVTGSCEFIVKPTSYSSADPYVYGQASRCDDVPFAQNPYIDHAARQQWARGWMAEDVRHRSYFEKAVEIIDGLTVNERRRLYEGHFDGTIDGDEPTAEQLGRMAFGLNIALSANPFMGPAEACQWAEGWQAARTEYTTDTGD
jgi:ribosome modulation factor